MAETHLSKTETPPPHALLVQMATALWVSHIVYVAAKLGLADHLMRPKRADELAGPTNTDAPSLYRLMRTLAHLGLMTEDGAQHFSLTPLGDALKTGAPGAARAAILTLALNGRQAEARARPRNLLLLTLDTTRPDRLGCYGSPAGATPHLDALAVVRAASDREQHHVVRVEVVVERAETLGVVEVGVGEAGDAELQPGGRDRGGVHSRRRTAYAAHGGLETEN